MQGARAKTKEEKIDYVMKNGLCYGCLSPGHRSRTCKGKCTCTICKGRHPTSLHVERKPVDENKEKETPSQKDTGKPKDEEKKAICGKVTKIGKGSMTSMIVPVWISTRDKPQREVLVYALLDTMSDTTFILEETVTKLNAPSEPTRLRLSTIATNPVGTKYSSTLNQR